MMLRHIIKRKCISIGHVENIKGTYEGTTVKGMNCIIDSITKLEIFLHN